MESPNLVIMAAGYGSRYGGLKQMEGIGPNGETLLEYSADEARKAGFGTIIIVLREEMLDEFADRVGRRLEAKCKVRYAFQRMDSGLESMPIEVPPGRTKPWGTGHALLCAEPFVDAAFAVANADDYYGADAFHKMAGFLQSAPIPDLGRNATTDGPLPLCMVAYPLSNTLSKTGAVSRGICTLDEQGRLVGIREVERIIRSGESILIEDDPKHTVLPPDTLVSMNFWGLVPGIFPLLHRYFEDFLSAPNENPLSREFYLPEAIGRMVATASAQVEVFRTDDRWLGITYPEDLAVVSDGLSSRVLNR